MKNWALTKMKVVDPKTRIKGSRTNHVLKGKHVL